MSNASLINSTYPYRSADFDYGYKNKVLRNEMSFRADITQLSTSFKILPKKTTSKYAQNTKCDLIIKL